MNLKRHLLTDEKLEGVKRLRAGGLSYRQIADAVDTSPSTVARILKPQGATEQREREAEKKARKRAEVRPWTDEEVMLAVRLRNEGWSDQRIAKHMGRTDGSVQGQLAYRHDDGRRINTPKLGSNIYIPPEVLADRDRRLSRPYTSLTQILMGDPV